MSEVTFNSLSCVACKRRKIRCDKKEPCCDRCSNSGGDCVYVQRRPRTRKIRPKENTLSGILQRLNNIEQLLSSGEAGSQSGEDGSPPMNLQINPATRTQVADSSLNVDRNSASSIHQMLTEATITTLGAFENNLACSVNALSKRLTVTTLNNALSNIETFKSSRRRSLHEYTSSPIHPDTARQWIRSCFAYMRQDGFIGLIDQRLILSIPDLALSPGVDIDPTALLCYHSLVLLGEMLDPNAQSKEPQHRRKELYFDCLKHVEAWEQHGSKTQLDMIVSGLLSWVAAEHSDYDLSRQFHLKACQIAHEHNLHQLDSNRNLYTPTIQSEEQREILRRGFWDLVQSDYLFQIYFQTDPSITKLDINVNLPSAISSSITTSSDESTKSGAFIGFILRSRIAFITKEFFDLLNRKPDRTTLALEVAKLCQNLESLIWDWNLMESLEKCTDSITDRFTIWVYGDIIVNAYARIILFEKRASEVAGDGNQDLQVPSARSVTAARTVMHTIYVISEITRRSAFRANVMAFYPLVAFFTLYYHILYCLSTFENDFTGVEEDLTIMEASGLIMEEAAEEHEDFVPMATAVGALTKVARCIFNGKKKQHSGSTSSSPWTSSSDRQSCGPPT